MIELPMHSGSVPPLLDQRFPDFIAACLCQSYGCMYQSLLDYRFPREWAAHTDLYVIAVHGTVLHIYWELKCIFKF